MEALQSALAALGLAALEVPGKGRGLVSARSFSPGDVVIQQEPYASTPSNFLSGSSCDGCFISFNLKKCSACRVAWYCGSKCQKSEWTVHRLECKALSDLGDDRRKMLTPSLRLMLRLLLRRKLQRDQVIQATATDNYDLVEALVSHMPDIDEKQLVLYAQMGNLVNFMLPEMNINIKEVTETFSKLACNAHTICDSELRPLGTGLYPIISIINHSCLPNSVLVFEGQRAVVRAVEPIIEGTEVSISYIDTASSTKIRQEYLKEHYFFTCACPRCVKVNSNKDNESAIMEGYRCRNRKCSGFLVFDSQEKKLSCQQCSLFRDHQEIKKIESDIKDLTDKASESLSSSYYSSANAFYMKVEELQVELYHSHSLDLLKTREELFKICMEVKDWKKALEYCHLTIPTYEKLYPEIHPLRGLQYYTCGRLEWLHEHTDEALKLFTKAVDILRITHGTSSPFMKQLLSQLEEARAEASYKVSASG